MTTLRLVSAHNVFDCLFYARILNIFGEMAWLLQKKTTIIAPAKKVCLLLKVCGLGVPAMLRRSVRSQQRKVAKACQNVKRQTIIVVLRRVVIAREIFSTVQHSQNSAYM